MEIRRARATDAPTIAALLTELGYPASAAEVEDRLGRLDGSDCVLVTVDRVQAAAEIDTVVADNFLKVAGFNKPPASLMHPSMMLRVAATNWRRKRHSGASVTPGYVTANPSRP